MDPAAGAGLVEGRCHICHEDGHVVAFRCRPTNGCTIKLCPACVGPFVHAGSRCIICRQTNSARYVRLENMRGVNHRFALILVLLFITSVCIVLISICVPIVAHYYQHHEPCS